MKLPYRAAIFDLDGTLFDSMNAWVEIDRRFFSKRNLPFPPDYPDAVKGLNFTEAAEYTVSRFSLGERIEDVTNEWLKSSREYYANEVCLKPHAKEFLALLRRNGVLLAIATSSKRNLFAPALQRCGIAEYFEFAVTTEEIGRGKAFPDIYLEAARRLGAAPADCAVFEDVVTAVKSARRAGFYTVAVRDDASLHEEEALKRSATRYVRSFAELL